MFDLPRVVEELVNNSLDANPTKLLNVSLHLLENIQGSKCLFLGIDDQREGVGVLYQSLTSPIHTNRYRCIDIHTLVCTECSKRKKKEKRKEHMPMEAEEEGRRKKEEEEEEEVEGVVEVEEEGRRGGSGGRGGDSGGRGRKKRKKKRKRRRRSGRCIFEVVRGK
ncbi:hypothetical protein BHE74_00015109 [Ensete ventricosum]|nr:hypothetical protein BHE74_00015109 [Ensete ventricosum]